MAQWRKVVVSGSSAVLNQVSASGNIVPKTTDGSSLGTSTLQFSDLFLGEGAVINWDGGDFTATQTNNLLALSGGNTRVDRLEVDSANDYIDVSTDLQVIAAADITLDPAGGNVKPASNDDAALGVAGTGWSDLFLAEGAVINWDSGDFTATQANNLLTLSGGNTRVDRLELDSASDYLDVDTDLKIVANADISLEPGGSDVLIGGNRISGSAVSTGSFGYLKVSGDGVFGGDITFGDANTDSVCFGADISSDLIPNADDTYDLGSASQAWQDLFLEGDITLTDAGTIATTAGAMTLTSAAAATWSTSAGALTIDGAGGLTLDSDGTDAVNLGTEAVAKTITIGNAASTKVDINALALDFDSAAATDILAATTVSVKGAGGASFGDDVATWEFNGSGAVSETGMTTVSITPSSTFDIDAGGAVTIDGSAITIGGDSDVAIDIDSSTLDIDASGALTIDSATSIAIGANADKPIDIDSTTLDIDASGAITIDGTSTILISGDGGATFSDDTEALVYDGSGNLDFDTVALDIDSSGAITIDGTSTFSVDVQGATNIDTTSGAISIGTANSGIAVNIGHSTSETTINDNLTITGDLTVNGDQTIVSTTNLAVEDKFAIFASGSTSDTDGGIIVQNAASAGYALGYDSGVDRWAFDADLAHNATNLVPDAYVGVVQVATTHGDSLAVPVYGGTTNGVGTIYVDTDDNEIWIYA